MSQASFAEGVARLYARSLIDRITAECLVDDGVRVRFGANFTDVKGSDLVEAEAAFETLSRVVDDLLSFRPGGPSADLPPRPGEPEAKPEAKASP